MTGHTWCFRTAAVLAAALFVLSVGHGAVAGPGSEAASLHVVPGAFQVSSPGEGWAWTSEKANSFSLARKAEGLEVIMRWVPNKSRLASFRLAQMLRLSLIQSPNSTGQRFSPVRKGELARTASGWFTIEQSVRAGGGAYHRSQYTTVAHGDHCLIVVVMGGTYSLDRHQTDIKALLDSIAFL